MTFFINEKITIYPFQCKNNLLSKVCLSLISESSIFGTINELDLLFFCFTSESITQPIVSLEQQQKTLTYLILRLILEVFQQSLTAYLKSFDSR